MHYIFNVVAGRSLKVEIRSEGCEDPDRLGPGCGWAFIKVDGRDYSFHERGHNVVVLDAETGRLFDRANVLFLFKHNELPL